MAEHVLLGMAPNEAMAALYLAQLRDLGLPVQAKQPLYPYPNAGAPHEIWLEDAAYLDDAIVSQAVEQLFLPAPAAADDLNSEAFNVRYMVRSAAIGVVAATVLFATWAFFFAWPRKPGYGFMRGAQPIPLPASDRDFFDRHRLFGGRYRVHGDYSDMVWAAKSELGDRWYVKEFYDRIVFMATDHVEQLAINMGSEPGSHNPSPRAQELVIQWGYRPSPSERVGAWLGR